MRNHVNENQGFTECSVFENHFLRLPARECKYESLQAIQA